MNIQVAVLCDAATDDNGKLNLLGCFDTIYAPQMPAVHPQCSVALRVTFQPEDEGTASSASTSSTPTASPSCRPSNCRCPSTLPDEAHFLTRNFIFNIQQLNFAEPGLYSRGRAARRPNRRRASRCW